MSYTTNILIATGCCDYDRLGAFREHLSASGHQATPSCPMPDDMSHFFSENAPGTKVYTNGTWAACWNYATLDHLREAFLTFEWDEPEKAVLIYSTEQNESQVFRPKFY